MKKSIFAWSYAIMNIMGTNRSLKLWKLKKFSEITSLSSELRQMKNSPGPSICARCTVVGKSAEFSWPYHMIHMIHILWPIMGPYGMDRTFMGIKLKFSDGLEAIIMWAYILSQLSWTKAWSPSKETSSRIRWEMGKTSGLSDSDLNDPSMSGSYDSFCHQVTE